MKTMTTTFRIAASILLAGGLAAGASAQSLADVARQTKVREKSVKTHGKVYTNADLPNAGDDSSAAAASQNGTTADAKTTTGDPSKAAADTADKKSAADAKPSSDSVKDAKGPVKDRAYWHKRITDAREMRDQAQLLLDAMQSRINALTADFAARDDPAQRAQIEQQRAQALSELDNLKKALKTANDTIDNIQEEARRAGVPPGWLR